jgi:hypothetical protein
MIYKTIYKVLVLLVILVGFAYAEEGYMCNSYFKDVQRIVTNIQTQDLSQMAKEKLYEQLKFSTGQCIKECEGSKFSYCNDVAKKMLK